MPAWRSVLDDLKRLGVDRVICLGDMVGYGPMPQESLDAVSRVCDGIILGNHEAAAASLLDLSIFNDHAQEMICWTANVLGQQSLERLSRLPCRLEFDAGGYTGLGVHSSALNPMDFGYVLDERDALACLEACEYRLIVLGHTHIPRADVQGPDGRTVSLPPDTLVLRPDSRYVLNIGSVGMARDGDPRACYGVLDTSAQIFSWRRVAFDLSAFQADIATVLGPGHRAAQMKEAFAHLWAGETRDQTDLGRKLVLKEAREWHTTRADLRREQNRKAPRKTVYVNTRARPNDATKREPRRPPPRRRKKTAAAVKILVLLLALLAGGWVVLHRMDRLPDATWTGKPNAPAANQERKTASLPPGVRPATPQPASTETARPAEPERPATRPRVTGGRWEATFDGNGAQSFRWDDASRWAEAGIPDGAGAEAVIQLGRQGIHTLNIQLGRDITVGKLTASEGANATMNWQRGHVLTFDNGESNALWHRYRTPSPGRALRMNIYTDLRLSSTLEASWFVQRGIEIDNQISGPGGFILHHTSADAHPASRQILIRGQPNTYEGGTTIKGMVNPERRVIVLVEKNGAFGTGDVTLNENVELVLTSRGARNDMIADSAALRLTRTERGNSRVTLRAGVDETIRLLLIDEHIQAAGTWGSSESPAEHKNDDFFSGPGILRVVP